MLVGTLGIEVAEICTIRITRVIVIVQHKDTGYTLVFKRSRSLLVSSNIIALYVKGVFVCGYHTFVTFTETDGQFVKTRQRYEISSD